MRVTEVSDGRLLLERAMEEMRRSSGVLFIKILNLLDIAPGGEYTKSKVPPQAPLHRDEQHLWALVQVGWVQVRSLGEFQFFRITPQKTALVQELIATWEKVVQLMKKLVYTGADGNF